MALDIDAPRLRHAARTAAGGVVIALLSQTPVTTGCLSSVLYYISLVAGTPEPYAGFVVRSSVLTFLASLVAAAGLVLVLSASSHAPAAAFFLYLPFTVVCSALRPDRGLLPFPVVVNVILGLLLISQLENDPATARAAALALVKDAALALAVAVAVCVPFADRADKAAHKILAEQLRDAGASLSSAAGCMLNALEPSAGEEKEPRRYSRSQDDGDGREERRGMKMVPESLLDVLSDDRRVSAEWEVGLPPGRSRVSSFTALARARQLLNVAGYEPRGTSRAEVDAGAWQKLVGFVTQMVAKVTSIEAAVLVGTPERLPIAKRQASEAEPVGGGGTRKGSRTTEKEARILTSRKSTSVEGITSRKPVLQRKAFRVHFSREYMLQLFGEKAIPLWKDHFVAVATACHVTSQRILAASDGSALGPLDDDVHARSPEWTERRVEMYRGFLCQFRRYWSTGSTNGLCSSHTATNTSAAPAAGSEQEIVKGSQLRPLIFVATASHALSEALARVQASLLGCVRSRRKVFSILNPFWLPLKPLWTRMKHILLLRIDAWEVKFAVTHAAMSATIVALSVFVPGLRRFEASQIAWIYASAGLAAQLTVESTLFIGVLRVSATFAAAFLAFGVNLAVKSTNSANAPLVLGPYMGAIAFSALLVLPRKFRYASFLFIVTNGLVSFCPRLDEDCAFTSKTIADSCFPDLQYAVARSVNVSIGVVFALLFHLLLWPRFAQGEARRALAKSLGNCVYMFVAIHQKYCEMGINPDSDSEDDSDDELDVLGVSIKPGGPSSSLEEETELAPGRKRTGAEPESKVYMVHVLTEEEVMQEVDDLNKIAQTRVERPLAEALLLLATDANSWSSGRLSLPDVLKELPEHFIALNVSLSEMASILGRRPILSGQYCRTAHRLFVVPLRYERDTLIVSLHNLSTVVGHILVGSRIHACLADLRKARRHLALTLRLVQARVSELRRNAHAYRREQFELLSDRESNHGKSSSDCLRRSRSVGSLPASRLPPSSSREKQSDDGALHSSWTEEPSDLLHADDVVLFNAFSFASNASVSAFLSIADVVEYHYDVLTAGPFAKERT